MCALLAVRSSCAVFVSRASGLLQHIQQLVSPVRCCAMAAWKSLLRVAEYRDLRLPMLRVILLRRPLRALYLDRRCGFQHKVHALRGRRQEGEGRRHAIGT